MPTRSEPTAPGNRVRLAVAAAAALATVQFLAPWWNHHLGLSLDGYMPWFGHRILSGEVPYRDFFLHLPPLHPLAEALLEAVVGKSILAGRIAGGIGHILIAALLALWLSRHYRPWVAVLAAIAAVTVATSDDTEILDLYNPHTALAALASGLFASFALDRTRRAGLWASLSGLAAGVSFWTKQTVGLGITVAVPVALLLISLRDPGFRAEGRRLGLQFVAGWGAIAAVLSGWLASQGALGAFVQQVFRDAAGSKGSPLNLLGRPWLGPIEMPDELRGPGIFGLVFALVAIACVRGRRRAAGEREGPRGLRSAAAGWAAATAMLLVGAWLARRMGATGSGEMHRFLGHLEIGRWAVVLFVLYGITALCAQAVWCALSRRLDPEERQPALFKLVAGAMAVTQALSMAVTGALAMPALALVTCHVADGLPRRRRSLLILVPVVAMNGYAIVSSVGLLHLEPFRFAGWYETGLRQADSRSSLAPLSGMVLSGRTIRTVDGLVESLRAASDPGEPIFTYSVYPLFYWLADRPSATFASLHWADVTPDRIVDRDIATLLEHPPVAILWQYLTEFELADNEAYYRGGKPSAVRRMNAAVAELLETRYVKVAALPSRADGRHGPPLEVWVRGDRAAARGLAGIR